MTIDHPAHYGGDTTYEAIKVIEAWRLGFCLGNCLEYICRAGRKSNTTALEVPPAGKAKTSEDIGAAVDALRKRANERNPPTTDVSPESFDPL